MATTESRALPWKIRPIFISSTFRDMQAERDYLRTIVFPRLEEELRKGRLLLEPIDLRQGVETADLASEESREQMVLKVCLEEIERSRPFLIVLLGDRYGWVPPESRLAAAVQEAGFATELRDKSVTALEIEYGVLRRNSGEQPRCLFYLRDPLPYEQMPESRRAEYSDEFSPAVRVSARHERLQALKKSLSADAELGSRVHRYRADWDPALGKVTGLENWGEQVFQHLMIELGAELHSAASGPALDWREQERAALAEFFALRSRNFVGRSGLLSQLTDIALAEPQAESTFAIPSGVEWGACVTGDAGLGKSALFAELARRLGNEDSIILLTNAAGATPRGSHVEAMLERFIQELSDVLDIAMPPIQHADTSSVETTFASLMARAAAGRRVVVLLDALDQFESTPRGQQLTWLRPRQWPANARLIATALPGPAADALSQWAGIEELEIPPLTITDDGDDDVTAITRSVWQSYHRQVNPAVLRALREKRTDDGRRAAGNALWLTLAVEQVNLLDSDDFARAEREFAGGPAERLRALLVDTAERMPPSVAGLYGWLLAQTEKVVGPSAARAFAALIAISRAGWRESDLMRLIPPAADLLCPGELPPTLDDLRLAAVRRSFRAHLSRHGSLGQLDFFHRQMREAVGLRILGDAILVRSLHRQVADHLESLQSADPIRVSELMVHLIAGEDVPRAARLYADLDEGPALAASTEALARHVASEDQMRSDSNASWVASFLTDPDLSDGQAGRLATKFVFNLNDALAGRTTLESRRPIQEAARSALEMLLARQPANADWLKALSFAHANLGHFAKAQGRFQEALHFYGEAYRVLQSMAESDPTDSEKAGVLWASLLRLSEVARIQGDLPEFQRILEECHRVATRQTDLNPTNAEWQSLLSIAHERLSNLAIAQRDWPAHERHLRESHRIRLNLVQCYPDDKRWQEYLAMSFDDLGEMSAAQGNFDEALSLYRESSKIRRQLSEREPADDGARRNLAIATSMLGDLALRQQSFGEAAKLLEDGHRIFQRLAETDPTDAERQCDLDISVNKLGRLARARGEAAAAHRYFRESHRIRQRVADMDPANLQWQSELAHSFATLGDLALSEEHLDEAEQHFGESLRIARQLSRENPENAEWQRNLAYFHYNLGIVAQRRKDTARFLSEMRKSFLVIQRIRQDRLYLVDPELEELSQRLIRLFGTT